MTTMTTFTINSRKHGKQTFTVNDNGGYVRCNGKQTCKGGRMTGETLTANEKTLESTSKKWWAAYLKNQCQYN